MNLAEKAEHYRQTGEYLAQFDEAFMVKENINDWLTQWRSLDDPSKDFYGHNFEHYINLRIGEWHCDNGFTQTHEQVIARLEEKFMKRVGDDLDKNKKVRQVILTSEFDLYKTSLEWSQQPKYSHICILDPDGWDRKNYQYSFCQELIDEKEFRKRLSLSTIGSYPNE